jgi:hypothetical protein
VTLLLAIMEGVAMASGVPQSKCSYILHHEMTNHLVAYPYRGQKPGYPPADYRFRFCFRHESYAMSKPVTSNIAKSSPLATVRRDQVAYDPLDATSSPAPTHNAPSSNTPQTRPSPKPPVPDPAVPFQRMMLPGEILDIETHNFLAQCRYVRSPQYSFLY